MQNTRAWFIVAFLAALVGPGSPAEAQVFTPTFTSPDAAAGAGVYASEEGIGGVAVEAIWRGDVGRSGFALRAGGADTNQGLALSFGGEVRGPITLTAGGLAFAPTAGAQGVFGPARGIGAQIGVTTGRPVSLGRVTATPYAHPRLLALALREELDGIDPGEEIGFALAVRSEFGVNLRLDPGLSIGIATGVGGGADLAVGVGWRR